ncbi:MAG: type II toxin-antitoxin system HipA family toxin, partial [Variovorax sp.]
MGGRSVRRRQLGRGAARPGDSPRRLGPPRRHAGATRHRRAVRPAARDVRRRRVADAAARGVSRAHLPDARATAHYIVKFGRGTDPGLASILRHEAPYMRIAAGLGLRVHAPLELRQRALFIPRFDRRVEAGRAGAGRVVRLAQESIATLTGMPGFEAVPSHDQVCRDLVRHCTDPHTEVLEYLRRDVANLALGNKDNHARNTAVQRDAHGRIGLTPLYDFAPMYLHPDGIARRIRWSDNDGGRPD